MSQVAGNARSRIGQRVDTVRSLVTREVDIGRKIVSDVRDRVGTKTVDNQPKNTENLGGAFGKRGSLIKEPVLIVTGTLDNVTQFIQENAAITRKMLSRSR